MKRLTIARKILCTAVLLCAAVWSVNANQIADPGFEASADGSGLHPFSASWTNIDPSGLSGVGGTSALAHSGNNYAVLGATPNFGSLSQNFSTVAGQSYNLSFWLANDTFAARSPINGFASNSFRVLFNGIQVFSLTSNSGPFDYTQLGAMNLVAAGGVSTLEFVYQNGGGSFRLDDVDLSATPTGTGNGVPDTGSSALLMGVALAGLFGVRRFLVKQIA